MKSILYIVRRATAPNIIQLTSGAAKRSIADDLNVDHIGARKTCSYCVSIEFWPPLTYIDNILCYTNTPII